MKNLINQIVTVLLILSLTLLLPLTLIFPEQAEFVLRYIADVFKANLVWLEGLTPAAHIGMRVLLAGLGLAVFVVGVVLVVLEMISFRRGTAKLRDGSGEIMLDGVSEHLAYHIDMLADVVRVQPKVNSTGNKVQVELYVETGPDVHIPTKTVEIQQKAKEVLEERLGLQLGGDIRVIIRPATLPKVKPTTTPQPAALEQPSEPLRPTESQDNEQIQVKVPDAD